MRRRERKNSAAAMRPSSTRPTPRPTPSPTLPPWLSPPLLADPFVPWLLPSTPVIPELMLAEIVESVVLVAAVLPEPEPVVAAALPDVEGDVLVGLEDAALEDAALEVLVDG